jgi:hypothetical protein
MPPAQWGMRVECCFCVAAEADDDAAQDVVHDTACETRKITRGRSCIMTPSFRQRRGLSSAEGRQRRDFANGIDVWRSTAVNYKHSYRRADTHCPLQHQFSLKNESHRREDNLDATAVGRSPDCAAW